MIAPLLPRQAHRGLQVIDAAVDAGKTPPVLAMSITDLLVERGYLTSDLTPTRKARLHLDKRTLVREPRHGFFPHTRGEQIEVGSAFQGAGARTYDVYLSGTFECEVGQETVLTTPRGRGSEMGRRGVEWRARAEGDLVSRGVSGDTRAEAVYLFANRILRERQEHARMAVQAALYAGATR